MKTTTLLSVLSCFILLSSCSLRMGSKSFVNPPREKSRTYEYGLELHLLKLGKKVKGEYRNPFNSMMEFSGMLDVYNVGKDCCQPASLLINGIRSGSTKVDTRTYDALKIGANTRFFPFYFMPSFQKSRFAPYLHCNLGWYRYSYNDIILTSKGKHDGPRVDLSSGTFFGIGGGVYYSLLKRKTEFAGNSSLFLEYNYDSGNKKGNYNLNGPVISLGIRLF